MSRYSIFVLMMMSVIACQKKTETLTQSTNETENVNVTAKFTLIPPEQSGVNFINRFKEDWIYNIFSFEYLYNGGGVAAGDVNGDSLPDLYFSATFGPNILYLNLGDFKFINVTVSSNVAASVGFKTGVAMADINGDGRLDIYSCRTSKLDNRQKTDHVFINMGNKMENGIAIPVFEDQSQQLGLDDNSNTNQVCFFDYDRDGDLDIFLLNHRVDFSETRTLRLIKQGNDSIRVTTPTTPFESNKLYRNDHNHFTEVTHQAGLVSSAFGLSASAGDFNLDGWLDLYVANDYIEPDRVYINNKNGTFTDHYFDYLKHSCQNSMGSDVVDFNNDGLEDIIVLDMKAEDPFRYKELINVMHYDRYNMLAKFGYGRQVGRNVLQLNNGNNTFSEIGQFAGIAATDWSWGALVADFDNDGWKDAHIANGYRKDVTNYDYLNYLIDSLNRTGGITASRYPDIYQVLNLIPEKRIANYLYINNKKLAFIDATKQAGMDQVSFSNGSALADLDRDGDLDIIINNVEDPAFIYRNDATGHHWLQIDILETSGNTKGIGTVVNLYAGGIRQHQRMKSCQGFYSSSEPMLHFGLGDALVVDSIILQWPDGNKEIMKSVTPDRRILWKRGSGRPYKEASKPNSATLFVSLDTINGWMHHENEFVDFKRERLLPYMLSYEGPCLSTGDVNGDKLEDVYVGNGTGFPSALFLQSSDNKFVESANPVFANESVYESCGSVLQDFDGDLDLDLIVTSGGNSFHMNDPSYMTRYYLNDGKGTFTRNPNFPILRTNAGAVLSFDYDQDKDLDIFIAGRCIPGSFPLSPKSHLLRNDKGRFVEVTKEVFPQFEDFGMITDIESGDMDGDGIHELIIAADWLPISIFSYKNSKFENATELFGLGKTSGWWKAVAIDDIDGDGDMDLIAGNVGLNNRLETSEVYPITLYSKDFDENGSQDPVLCFYYQGKLYPYAGRDALISQVPVLKKKFVRYSPYAKATIEDIFGKEKLKGALKLTANTLKTFLFINEQNKLVPKDLPYEAQLSPVYDIIIRDFNEDGKKDILMAGNFLYSDTETGEMDAGNGTLLSQNPDGNFTYIPNTLHGYWAQDEVREMKTITLANGQVAVLTANNKGPIEIYRIAKSERHEQ